MFVQFIWSVINLDRITNFYLEGENIYFEHEDVYEICMFDSREIAIKQFKTICEALRENQKFIQIDIE